MSVTRDISTMQEVFSYVGLSIVYNFYPDQGNRYRAGFWKELNKSKLPGQRQSTLGVTLVIIKMGQT